eukprot:2044752-Prymnesium_polylepis.1
MRSRVWRVPSSTPASASDAIRRAGPRVRAGTPPWRAGAEADAGGRPTGLAASSGKLGDR